MVLGYRELVGIDKVISIDDEVKRDGVEAVLITNRDIEKVSYEKIRDMLIKGIKIVYLMDGELGVEEKQVIMLLASYKSYNVYVVDRIDEINEDYINKLVSREASIEEMMMYISEDATVCAEIGEVLSNIVGMIDAKEEEKILEELYRSREVLEGSVATIDGLKAMVDKTKVEMNGVLLKERDEKVKLGNELKKKVVELEEKDKRCRAKEDEVAKVTSELTKLKGNLTRQSSMESNTGGYELERIQLDTNKVDCKNAIILYFKEISKIRYIDSFITRYVNILKRKLRVKLMVYVEDTPYNKRYMPLEIIDDKSYVQKLDLVKSDESIVVTAKQPALLNDVLTESFDVVIIYDRLNRLGDLVVGNNVYKYYVVNSQHDIAMLKKHVEIDRTEIISLPGVEEDGIGIGEISDYKNRTDGWKDINYAKLSNIGKNTNNIFDIINERTCIDILMKKRKS